MIDGGQSVSERLRVKEEKWVKVKAGKSHKNMSV